MNKEFDSEKILTQSQNLNRDYIDNIASRELSVIEFITKMRSKYEYLNNNFKSIFDMCITKHYDYNRLKYMVSLANQVKNDEITEHDASVKVGQVLVDDIVKPQLDNSS
jgi:hypothetical protein